jgi:hypothetical protein
MLEKTIIPLALFLMMAAPALSESLREKVIVYDLRVVFEKDVGSGAAGEERYDYYSPIIPYTIARNLESTGKFDVRKIDGMLPFIETKGDLFFDQMGKIGAEHSARYIITGSVTVTGKKLAVELIIIHLRAKNIFKISRESLETGVELIQIIDDITADIGQRLALYQKETERSKEAEARVEVSPFMKAYRALENLSFGAKAGRFFIKGPFTRAYEDSDYLTPYLGYGITGWFGISAEADLLKAENGNISVLKKSSMLLHGLTLNGNFSYRFFTHFGVRLSVGGGTSISRIYLNASDNPFNNLVVKKQSVDPYLNLSASFNIIFKPIELQFGSAYKHAFFKGGDLQLIAVFCGVGFHI